MGKMLIQELKDIPDGNVLTWSAKPIKYIVKNTDELEENCLYFCFEEAIEESLLQKLVRCKASGVVVPKPCGFMIERWQKAGIGIIEVDNSIMFQIALAKIYRAKFKIPLIQVIGSAGKTTAKDMIGAVLNAGMPALVGYGNYNTAFGAALNILNLRDFHQAAVVEAGMKSIGYMRFSSSIIKPSIAVLTSIQRAHYVTLGSIEKIIEAKAEILEFLDQNGALIINGEDKHCDKFPVNRYKGRVLRYGFSAKYDLWAADIRYKKFKTYFVARGKGIKIDCVLNTVGKYNVTNALAAVLVGLELGMKPGDIRRGLTDFKPMARRLKMYDGPLNTILIDDNFNANPDSTKLLLEELPKFTENRPIMLVMGDVERPDDQIKQYAEEVHFSIGRQIARINFEKLIAIGKWAEEYVKGAKSAGVPQSKMVYFETVKQAQEYFKAAIIPGSVILFKASVYVTVRNLIKSLRDL
ncbi:MAG: UDP-N-acetylmuramoyl-tripeptide--D-alanyl-D-alanine ligase [Bacillota bacterium]|jgi:UDP-N-acetylmuramoyl-tripeptide--D-alanyl-D-alanine ligase